MPSMSSINLGPIYPRLARNLGAPKDVLLGLSPPLPLILQVLIRPPLTIFFRPNVDHLPTSFHFSLQSVAPYGNNYCTYLTNACLTLKSGKDSSSVLHMARVGIVMHNYPPTTTVTSTQALQSEQSKSLWDKVWLCKRLDSPSIEKGAVFGYNNIPSTHTNLTIHCLSFPSQFPWGNNPIYGVHRRLPSFPNSMILEPPLTRFVASTVTFHCHSTSSSLRSHVVLRPNAFYFLPLDAATSFLPRYNRASPIYLHFYLLPF